MSTWKAAVYRDDAWQALAPAVDPEAYSCEFMRSLLDWDIEDPGDYPVPPGVRAGNARQLAEVGILDPELLLPPERRATKKSPGLTALVQTLPSARTGIYGVYTLAATLRGEILRNEPNAKADTGLIEQLFAFGSAGSYRSKPDVEEKHRCACKAYARCLNSPYNLFQTILHITPAARVSSYQASIREADRTGKAWDPVKLNDPGAFAGWDVYVHRSTLILVNPPGSRAWVLTRDDITRLEKVIKGIAHYRFYFGMYGDCKPAIVEKMSKLADKIVNMFFDTINKLVPQDANVLVRAYDVVYNTYLAEQSDDINSRAKDEQSFKWRKENLGRVLEKGQLLRIVSDSALRDALELLSFHKTLPQPDFDYFGAAKRQGEKWGKPVKWGDQVADEDTGNYRDLLRYYKYTMLRAYHARHGVCPGYVPLPHVGAGWTAAYPNVNPAVIPPAQVDIINMDGAFQYTKYGTAVLDFLKDKGMAPLNLADVKTDAEYAKLPIECKNFLMWALSKERVIDIQELRGRLDDLFMDGKADDKSEAKKPFGRWFFSFHGEIRLVQSEYEANISDYAKYAPGVMQGKSVKDAVMKMNRISKPRPEHATGARKPLLISFDLEAFSPTYPGAIHRDTDAINARLFGEPTLARAHEIHARGNIHYIKNNIHHVVPKPDRDFEGISGKKNTVYHSAVMGYAVSRLRALGLIDLGGTFADLIDDGVLRLDLSPAQYANNIPRILQVIEKVYALGGWRISWDKTFVSSHLCTFLSEIRYDGTRVTPGVRAFLKVTSRQENVAPSLLGEIGTLEATVRGAITANSFQNAAYALYTYNIADLMRRWGGKSFRASTTLAVAAFAPVALGGLGCTTLTAMGATVATVPLTEGIGRLRAIAVRFPATVPGINKMINQEMRGMSVEAQVRSPLAVRREGRVLKTVRAKIEITSALLKKLHSPVVRAILGTARGGAEHEYAETLMHDVRIAAEAIDLLWQSSLGHALDVLADKFLRSGTAMRLVPIRRMFRAAVANRTEAAALIKEWNR